MDSNFYLATKFFKKFNDFDRSNKSLETKNFNKKIEEH